MIWCRKCQLWRRTEDGSCRWCSTEARFVPVQQSKEVQVDADSPTAAAIPAPA
jgi:hypothetical protein